LKLTLRVGTDPQTIGQQQPTARAASVTLRLPLAALHVQEFFQ